VRAFALVLVVNTVAFAAPSMNPETDLAEGRDAYQRGQYEAVEKRVYPLLYPNVELPSQDSVIEAHRLLALAYFFQKKPTEARQEVLQILSLRPAFQLDPIVEPRVAVSFFENIKKEQQQRLDEIIRRRQQEERERLRIEEERRRAQAERIYVEKEVVKHSRLFAAVPFGVGQWQNGHKKLAVFFAVTEALTGALSLACFVSFYVLQPPGSLGLSLSATTDAAGAAFWGLVLAGIIDAEVRFKPEEVRVRELPRPKKISWSLFGVQGAF